MTAYKNTLWISLMILMALNHEAQAGGFSEGFENINQLTSSGWIFDNQSDFIGDLSWSQGFASTFPAQEGPDNSYLLGGVGQTGGNVLCDWLILPEIGFVEQLNFHTRTVSNSIAPDRLLVVYSASGGTNTGPCVNNDVTKSLGGNSEFGDFEPLLSINPNLQSGEYPTDWMAFNVPVNGDGRLAFVYFVENVGQNPFNGNLIAIDSLNIGPGSPPVGPGPATAVPSLTYIGLMILLLLVTLVGNQQLKKTE